MQYVRFSSGGQWSYMMLSKADDYPIHQTPDPIAFSGTDRNFYDRYFFNGYTIDGDVFFAAALGVYPHLNIIDAGFAVRIGGRQFNLHASRHLHMERMDTQVGPIRVEVIEPLKVLRIIVDDNNEHGISADITISGRHAPIEEPRNTRRNGPRIVQDVTRMTQLGRWSGWIKVSGQTITLDEATTPGTRDRSWGVRHVGIRDPQVPVVAQEFQVWWVWLPAHFEDRVLHFFVNEDGDGKVWNLGAMMVRDGGAVTHLHGAKLDMEFAPVSRFPARAVVTAKDEAGGEYRIEATPQARFFLSGIGYMNPDWSHGLNKGPLALGYDEIDSNTPHGSRTEHPQAFATVSMTTPDGSVLNGHGCFESIVIGRHSPSGFTSMFDVP